MFEHEFKKKYPSLTFNLGGDIELRLERGYTRAEHYQFDQSNNRSYEINKDLGWQITLSNNHYGESVTGQITPEILSDIRQHITHFGDLKN